MDKINESFPMHVGIVVTSAAQLASVYALLGASALAGVMAAPAVATAAAPEPAPTAAAPTAAAPTAAAEQSASAAEASPAADSDEVDAGGWPWSADLHASTKGKTKDGYWRMKVGVTRPADKPGFSPSNAAAAAPGSPEASQSASAGDAGSAAAPAAEASSDDDEFAAFREAAAKTDAEAGAAAAAVPARKWTDADLGALCNQAAVKLGDPSPIKEIIAQFVAEGEVAHSRNIAEDKRADFAAAVEAKAGITFAG